MCLAIIFAWVIHFFILYYLFIFINTPNISIVTELTMHLQRSKTASTVGKCRGFCRGISVFFSIYFGKKNAKAIRFLGILKNLFSNNEKYTYFCLKKKKKCFA